MANKKQGTSLSSEIRELRDAKNSRTKARNVARKQMRKDNPELKGKKLKKLSDFDLS